MARIRTIKPDFFTSEDIVSLSPLARLLYQAIWCEADREGRLMWKPITLKLRYFPADNIDIFALCDELLARNLVILYGDPEEFAYIPTFALHQHVNPREAGSILPDPPTRAPRVPHASSRVTDAQVGKERKGKERKDIQEGGVGETKTSGPDPTSAPAVAEASVPDERKATRDRILGRLNTLKGKCPFREAKALGARVKKAALKDLPTLEQEATLILEHRWAMWSGDDKMSRHLVPDTIWGASHWDTYLTQAADWAQAGRPSLAPSPGKPVPDYVARDQERAAKVAESLKGAVTLVDPKGARVVVPPGEVARLKADGWLTETEHARKNMAGKPMPNLDDLLAAKRMPAQA